MQQERMQSNKDGNDSDEFMWFIYSFNNIIVNKF